MSSPRRWTAPAVLHRRTAPTTKDAAAPAQYDVASRTSFRSQDPVPRPRLYAPGDDRNDLEQHPPHESPPIADDQALLDPGRDRPDPRRHPRLALDGNHDVRAKLRHRAR